MIFVNSMSDLFQKGVPDAYVSAVFDTMLLANWHVYQLLTKRARRLREFTRRELPRLAEHKHIWLGVSVEDRRWGLPRIDELREASAGVKFLSVEPLLEDLGVLDLSGIDWVIVGGESGLGARPMEPGWALSIRDQCRDAGVPFFFKQWGGVRKKVAGRELEGRCYDELPELHRAPPPARAERNRRVGIVEQQLAAGL